MDGLDTMSDYPYQLWGPTTDGLFAYELHVGRTTRFARRCLSGDRGIDSGPRRGECGNHTIASVTKQKASMPLDR